MSDVKKFAALIRRYVGDPEVLFEFGARDGAETLMIASEFPEARVFSFECNEATLPLCREKAATNPRITLIENAVGDTNGTVAFHPIDTAKTITTWADGNPGASSLFLASGKYEVESYVQRSEEVCMVRPDTFMAANGIEKVDAIWMDIQGAELMALRGLGERIYDVGFVSLEAEFIEIYGGQPLFWEIYEFLTSKGFFLISFLTLGRHSCDAVFVRGERQGFLMGFRSRGLLLYAKFMILLYFPVRRGAGRILRKCGLRQQISSYGKVIS
jgi:FkbM family methyltransferase